MRIFNLLSVTFLFILFVGAIPGAAQETSGTQTLLIINFKNISAVYGEGASVKSPISNRVFRCGTVQAGAENIIASHALNIVKTRGEYVMLPSSKAPAITAGIVSGGGGKFLSERELVIETARTMGADFVMAGYVYRFAERVGRNYSAESPASVAFGVHILRAKDGRVIWSRHFDETQRALSDNLFEIGTFFKRGGKWVTAEEMARMALEDMIQ